MESRSVSKNATYPTKLSDSKEKGKKETEFPLPKPVTRRKKDIVMDVSMFNTVDEHARKTPEQVRLSIDKLAKYLCSVASTELERVRSFYYWICNNIRNDRDKKGDLKFDAVSTLRQGQGSYVELMSALCKEASIPAVKISGCSKGFRDNPDRKFSVDESNHAWNAVYIDGEWRLIDCTWGSGYIDSKGNFQQRLDEFWFLTDPEFFVYDHFPSDPSWQLLEHPVDIDEFNTKPSLTKKSKEVGLQLLSHREPVIYVQNEVIVSLASETIRLSNITADLKTKDGTKINQHRCMRRVDANQFEIIVVPPEIGEYKLLIYGRTKDYIHAKFRQLTAYTLRCETASSQEVIYPAHSSTWGPEPNYAEYGLADSIQKLSIFKSSSNETKIELEQTTKTTMAAKLTRGIDKETDYSDFIMVTASETGKVIHVRFPTSGFYKLDIYVKGKAKTVDQCASFLLECTVSQNPKIYPKYCGSYISEHDCELLEPMQRELPADTMVTFRLRSTKIQYLMLGIPREYDYGTRLERLGELESSNNIFTGEIKMPKAGETMHLSGGITPPYKHLKTLYEFVSVIGSDDDESRE